MTRRLLIKQTYEYIQRYVFALFLQALTAGIIFFIFYKPAFIWIGMDFFFQVSSLVLLGVIFILNFTFYYVYLYDIYKKNIYQADIIELGSSCVKGRVNILGRVFEGEMVGQPKINKHLKSRRDNDYIFKLRGRALYDYTDHYRDKIRIRYLKCSKAIVQVESLIKDVSSLLIFSEEKMDYVYDKYAQIPIEEAKQILKVGKITRIKLAPKVIAKKIVGGIIYGILLSPVIYIIEKTIVLLLMKLFE